MTSESEIPNTKISSAVVAQTIGYFFREVKKAPLLNLTAFLIGIVAIFAHSYGVSWVIAIITDKVTKLSDFNGDILTYFLPSFLWLAGLLIVSAIAWRISILAIWEAEIRGYKNLQRLCFRHITSQSMTFHSNKFAGSLVSATNKMCSSYMVFMDLCCFDILSIFISFFAVGFILGPKFPLLAVCILAVSLLFYTVVIFSFKKQQTHFDLSAKAGNMMSGRLSDTFTNIFSVKSFSNERYENKAYKNSADAWGKRENKVMWSVELAELRYSLLASLLLVSVLASIVIGRIYWDISVETIVLAITYALIVSELLWRSTWLLRSLVRVFGDCQAMVEILNEPITVQDKPNAKDLQITNAKIEFTNVRFSYKQEKTTAKNTLESSNSQNTVDYEVKSKKQLFNNFNLTILPGQSVGLVGHSGGGKTTLTKLLLRFCDVDAGKICIDGQNINDITQNSLHKAISYVQQEPELFHRSIRENISYGKLDASDDDIKFAAKKANALDFINAMPQGLDTLTGERGVKLSGGQKQRIALARAILKNAPILIFDEATSALDTESERLIQKSISHMLKNRTSIVIAHRLSTVMMLDRILVIEDGMIVQDGKHEDLISVKGVYQSLWQQQTGHFV